MSTDHFFFFFSAALILLGCGLAYLSRNIDAKFGEARQLIFALYNIAFTGLIIVLILLLVNDMSQSSKYALQAIGVFWASLVGSSAFVLPRLMQVKEATRNNNSAKHSSVHISGIDLSSPLESSGPFGLQPFSGVTQVKEEEAKDTCVAREN